MARLVTDPRMAAPCGRVSNAPIDEIGFCAWNPPLENINALVASGGPRLLARSRELVVTNGYAANACEAFWGCKIG